MGAWKIKKFLGGQGPSGQRLFNYDLSQYNQPFCLKKLGPGLRKVKSGPSLLKTWLLGRNSCLLCFVWGSATWSWIRLAVNFFLLIRHTILLFSWYTLNSIGLANVASLWIWKPDVQYPFHSGGPADVLFTPSLQSYRVCTRPHATTGVLAFPDDPSQMYVPSLPNGII